MRALRKLTAEPGLELLEIPEPVPGPGEVLVHVEAASLCGTDLHIQAWDGWARERMRPPVTVGHEFCGTVIELGPEVRGIEVGAYVSAESHVTCGACAACRTGRAHLCPTTSILGVDRDGALAEVVAVPAAVLWLNQRALMAPEIATLQEPFGNAVLATSDVNLAGETVAVLGCGPIGLFTIAICRAAGAALILASDRAPYRLELARQMGADAVLDVTTVDDVPAWFADAGAGEGAGVVFEMSGAAVADACTVARNGGRVILFGLPPAVVELPLAQAVICKNLVLQGVHGRRVFDTWYRTRALLESGAVDLAPLISHRLDGLEGVEDALALLALGDACKVVVYPNGRAEPARVAEALATA